MLGLAVEGNVGAPLWPAAGIALGGLLIWGWRCWPGIWLGAFASDVLSRIILPAVEPTTTLFASSTLIASAAALQAVLAAKLTVRVARSARPLMCEGQVIRFLLLAGPLACLVAASLAVTGLGALGQLQPTMRGATWLAWWAGDSVGVLLFAPLVYFFVPGLRLRDMPINELKVDRSFVHGAAANAKLGAIFSASQGLARQLGLDFVAEGVDDVADWHFLHAARCDYAQGYFIARPMPAADFPAWIADWRRRLKHLCAG